MKTPILLACCLALSVGAAHAAAPDDPQAQSALSITRAPQAPTLPAALVEPHRQALTALHNGLGSGLSLPVVWNLADITNGLMAIPNLVSLLLLQGVIVAETRTYLWSGRLDVDASGGD